MRMGTASNVARKPSANESEESKMKTKITLYRSAFKTIDGENEIEVLLRTIGYTASEAENINDITLSVEVVGKPSVR